MKQKTRRITMLLFLLVLQFSYSQNQKVTVTGIVSDQTGPLPGVVVIIKNTTTGTQTNFDGFFTLKANIGDTLEITYIGMISVEKTIQNSNPINIRLKENTENLDEVIIVAFGKQTKKSIVGAVSIVSSDVIENQQITSITSALQGNIAGVNIISGGGQPGENPTIRIRGIGSINASADPLIILDGAPFNGNLNAISSDQIESMTVLKDASSTSLYGSRGANGVILINTKRGKFNTPTKVTFKTTFGLSGPAVERHQLIDTDTFTEYSWEALKNSNQYINGDSPEAAAQNATNSLVNILGYNPYGNTTPVGTDGKLISTNKLWDTNWADLIQNNSATRVEHSFGISGGSDTTTHSFSLNYLDQEGSIQTSNFERITSRLSIDTKVNKWFKTGVSLFYSTSSQNYPNQSGTSYSSTIQWINNISSYYPLYRRDEAGSLIKDGNGNNIYDYGISGGQSVNVTRPQFQGENIVGSLYLYEILNKRDNFTANGYAQFQLTKDITFKSQISYEKYTYDYYEYNDNEYGTAASVNGRVSQDRNFTVTKNIINSFAYKKSFDDHSLNIDLIQEAFDKSIDKLGAQGTGYLPGVKVLDGSTTPVSVTGSLTNETLLSYLGRAAYNYKEKYFFEASFRTDGSSRFGSDVRWGNFFSIGGSWILSDEEFIQSIEQINFLKLRTSYGELGNNQTLNSSDNADYFPYLSLYETGWNELGNTGVLLGNISDPLLTWEKTASFNVGLDFGLFGQYLNGSVDYYSKKSVDLIYDQPLALSTGNPSIKTNIGSIKNYGVEVVLRSNIYRDENFKWTTALNFSFDRNKITELTQDSFINGTKRWEVGKSLYDFYIREWAGVDPSTGEGMWYMDTENTEGDITRDVTNKYSKATKNYTDKSSLPTMIGGFSNNLVYKQFDLNILFNYSFGAYVYDSSYASLMSGMEDAGSPGSIDLAQRWQNPGDITNTPRLLNSQNDYSSTSDRFLFANDYIRLKALTFGYNLPELLTDKLLLSKFRVFIQGDNLFTWQSHKGIDPEQSIGGTTDNRSYNLKTLSLGLNLEF